MGRVGLPVPFENLKQDMGVYWAKILSSWSEKGVENPHKD